MSQIDEFFLIEKYFNELRQLIMMDNEAEGHKLIRLIYCDHFFEYVENYDFETSSFFKISAFKKTFL